MNHAERSFLTTRSTRVAHRFSALTFANSRVHAAAVASGLMLLAWLARLAGLRIAPLACVALALCVLTAEVVAWIHHR
ncbi:MAG TPA: hypothetical protein VFW00_07775 [Rhodocyclaceae bacterium]|nr:hypothetical protein [Rhodocyclaceae bacterium]